MKKVRYPELKKVVDEINRMRERQGMTIITHKNITRERATKIFNYIDNELSPEWVWMDGEATPEQAEARVHTLREAASNLWELGYAFPEKCPMLEYYL